MVVDIYDGSLIRVYYLADNYNPVNFDLSRALLASQNYIYVSYSYNDNYRWRVLQIPLRRTDIEITNETSRSATASL